MVMIGGSGDGGAAAAVAVAVVVKVKDPQSIVGGVHLFDCVLYTIIFLLNVIYTDIIHKRPCVIV